MMMCPHHYDGIQSIFTAHKNLCTLCIHLSSLPKLLATIDIFIVSIALPFPEWHRVAVFIFSKPHKSHFVLFCFGCRINL